MISVKLFVDRMASILGSERAWLAEQRIEKVRELAGIEMPTLRERTHYARTVFDSAVGTHDATRMLFRMWESAPTVASRTKIYELMRHEARYYAHLVEVFRLLEAREADLELAEMAFGRAA